MRSGLLTLLVFVIGVFVFVNVYLYETQAVGKTIAGLN